MLLFFFALSYPAVPLFFYALTLLRLPCSGVVCSPHRLLLSLQTHPVSIQTLGCSRIHLTLLSIYATAVQWPACLVDEVLLVEAVRAAAIDQHSASEKAARLRNICGPEDITRDTLDRRLVRSLLTIQGHSSLKSDVDTFLVSFHNQQVVELGSLR